MERRGPLHGVRIVEVASIGPGPFTAMMLADLGAEIVRIDRPESPPEAGLGEWNFLYRGRRSAVVDLKTTAGRELVLELCEKADGLIEGFRPGVMERMGLGPDVTAGVNRRLVYGRVTGYGQEGPLSTAVGHDINYISLAGVLGPLTRTGDKPLFPMNLIGDFGGGGMLLAIGMLAALFEARGSGLGQVVDAAMIDGAALLSTMIQAMRQNGDWDAEPGSNLLDSGAHFYEVYTTSCGGHVSVGAIENRFYLSLLETLGLREDAFPQWDRERWPELKKKFALIFAERSREDWVRTFEGTDACVSAVLSLAEAPDDPHNQARSTFTTHGNRVQPGPAPRFSRTQGSIQRGASLPGADTDAVLESWGIDVDRRSKLREIGAIA